MTKIELKAHLALKPLGFDEGITAFFDILGALQKLDAFAPGWEGQGHSLTSDPDGFRAMLHAFQETSEGFAGGIYFAVAESARTQNGQPLQIEQYLAVFSFDANMGRLTFDLKVVPALATLSLFRDVIRILQNRWPLQHVAVEDPFYAQYDRMFDTVNRPGIGWMGWIPFAVTHAQLPQATIVEPMGPGSFVAMQDTFWNHEDRAAVARAQALEERLNGMGMLPTFRVLSDGTWGQGG